jgi:hypothetical protein|tara:strand:- start:1454 stop:1666 length:213 start_codon:yes stop_codon:yes gene_type:complete
LGQPHVHGFLETLGRHRSGMDRKLKRKIVKTARNAQATGATLSDISKVLKPLISRTALYELMNEANEKGW